MGDLGGIWTKKNMASPCFSGEKTRPPLFPRIQRWSTLCQGRSFDHWLELQGAVGVEGVGVFQFGPVTIPTTKRSRIESPGSNHFQRFGPTFNRKIYTRREDTWISACDEDFKTSKGPNIFFRCWKRIRVFLAFGGRNMTFPCFRIVIWIFLGGPSFFKGDNQDEIHRFFWRGFNLPLAETKSLHLKIDGWKMGFLFGVARRCFCC